MWVMPESTLDWLDCTRGLQENRTGSLVNILAMWVNTLVKLGSTLVRMDCTMGLLVLRGKPGSIGGWRESTP